MLTPEEIDSIGESPSPQVAQPKQIGQLLSPEAIDAIEPAGPVTRAVDNRIPDIRATTAGGPPSRFTDAGDTFEELGPGPSKAIIESGRMVGRTLGMAGSGVHAIAADIAEAPAQIAGYQEPLRNLRSLGTVKSPLNVIGGTEKPPGPQPFEQDTAGTTGVNRFLRTAFSALAKTEPQMAVGFGLGAVGAPASVAAAGPMLVTPQGEYDPIGAAIAAGLPGVTRFGEETVANALAKLPISQVVIRAVSEDPLKLKGRVIQKLGGVNISNDQFRKFLESGGGFLAANAYLLATRAPEIAALDPKQRRQTVMDMVASNIAPSLLGFIKPGISQSLEQLGQKIAPQMGEAFDLARSVRSGAKPPGPEAPPAEAAAEPAPPPVQPKPGPTSGPLTVEAIDAIDTKQQQQGAGAQHQGADEVGETPGQAGGRDRLPGPAGKSAQGQGQPAADEVGGAGQTVPEAQGSVPKPAGKPVQPGSAPTAPNEPKAVPGKETATGVERFRTQFVPGLGNAFSAKVGLELSKPDDLDKLARIRAASLAKVDMLKEQSENADDPNEKIELLEQATAEHSRAQLAREAIEVATNSGGWIEGSKMPNGKTLTLGDRPLDAGKNAAVAKWLKANAAEVGIEQPAVPAPIPAPETKSAIPETKAPSDATKVTESETPAPKPQSPTVKPKGRSLKERAADAAKKAKENWKPIGQNSSGNALFEDDNGVRSYVEGGIRVTEEVSIIPTRGGVIAAPPAEHGKDYTPVDTAKPEAQPLPDAEQPAKSGVSDSGTGGSQPAASGAASPAEEVSPAPSGSSPSVQPGAGPTNEGQAGEPGTGSGGTAPADAVGVPAEQRPPTPEPEAAGGDQQGVGEIPGQPSEANPAPVSEVGDTRQNVRLAENPAPVSLGARAKANIDCIALVKKLEKEGRQPTDDELAVLAKWSGWGSFKEMFNEGRADRRDYDPGWIKSYGKNYDRLRELLTPEEFNAAAESSVNAHYTSKAVVDPMWSLVTRLGFKGGRVLEPSFGSGVFAGYMPEGFNKTTQWTAIELEPLTGKIASYLYPKIDVRIQGFEEAKIPNGFYDLAISNVPFHEVGPGKEYPDLNLHNYFLARMLDKVKPGGLVVAITTANTMESRPLQRKLIAGKGQLVGAIRLPSNAFKESAGTEVVTDILVLRKPDGRPFDAQRWENQVSIEMPSGKGGEPKMQPVNEYFVEHPDMVLGEHSLTGTMYRKESYTVIGKGDLSQKLADALAKFPENITQQEETRESAAPEQTQLEDHTLMLDADGKVMEAIGFKLQLPEWDSSSGTLVRRAKDYIKLRDSLMKQYALEGNPATSDVDMEANRKELRDLYNAWLKTHGTVNMNSRKMDMFSADPGFYPVMGLEKVSEVVDPNDPAKTNTVIEPSDVLSQRVIPADVPPDHVNNATDALGVSLAYRGRLDPEFLRSLTGMNDQQIEAELMGNNLAFKDPESGLLVTNTDYLSGDVRDKLAKAIFAAKESDAFQRNVDALRATIPETMPFDRISVGISARWTPVPVISAFANRVIGLGPDTITLVPKVEEFMVKESERWQMGEQARAQWSTEDMTANRLLEHALNFKRAEIRRRTDDDKYVVDEDATALANQVIERMRTEYVTYVRTTQDTVKYRYFDADAGAYRTEDLPIWDAMEREYNKKFNSFVDPKFDGSVLKLPGLSSAVRRTPHLLNGVMRAIMAGSAVFAHGVGSGKSFLLIVAAHELQRIGLAKKAIIAVKKPTVAQFRTSIERAYPGSKCLIPSKKDFEPANRKKLVSRIASGRWDFVILTHEQFKSIRTGDQLIKDFYSEQVEALRSILREMGEASAEDAKSTRGMVPAVRNIIKKIKSLKKRLGQHVEAAKKRQDKSSLGWEDVGVDGLFVDECFTEGTFVQTELGMISIGDIVSERISVRVMSRDPNSGKFEWKQVVGWFKMPLRKQLVIVRHEFGNFTCTADHKVWTQNRGYCHASHLNSSDTLVYSPLRMVQGEPYGQDDQSVLQPVVFGEVEKFTTTVQKELVGACEARVGSAVKGQEESISLDSNEGQESNARSGKHREDEAQKNRPYFSVARREWAAYDPAESIVLSNGPSAWEDGMGDCDSQSKISVRIATEQLQGGHSNAGDATCHRGRWALPQNKEVEVPGQTEDFRTKRSRVVSVEVYQQARDGRPGDDSGRVAHVYDIEVEGNHNFFADGVLVSNSHNFKKIPIPTQMDGDIKGIPNDFSQRAVDLLVKVRNVQQRTSGRNVFFASGTPVSNTLAELWVQFHATNPNLLKAFSVETFDSFASTFADVVSNFEYGWDDRFHDVTRMARFKNPSGLTMLTRLGMDVRMGNKELGLDVPDLDGGKPNVVIVKPTKPFQQWLELLQRAVTAWDNAEPKERFFNSWIPITVMRAGVAAALDPRCAFLDAEDDPNSKVNQAIRMIRAEWARGKEDRTTMMVFADMYRTINTTKLMGFIGGEAIGKPTEIEAVPDAPAEAEGEEEAPDASAKDEDSYVKHAVGGFNLYYDIKSKLVSEGIPEHEVAIITEHDTDAKRDALFNKVRSGQVRILIGSTEKIGEGVDVPQRMSAQFHLDPPMQMTPAKMEQRIGRIIRQGNLHSPKNWNKPVRVHFFAQERSMDAAIYQMLQTKGEMILQAIRGQYLGDSFEDPASELTMAMAEMKAAATGDPRVLEFAKLKKEVRDLSLEEGAFTRRKSELRRDIDNQTRAQRYALEAGTKFRKLADAIVRAVENKDAVTLIHVRSQKRVTGTKEIEAWLKAAQSTMRTAVKEPKSSAEMSLIFGDNVRCKLEMVHRLRSAYDSNGNALPDVSEFNVSATYYLGGPEPAYDSPRWDSSLGSVESALQTLQRIPANARDRALNQDTDAEKAGRLAAAFSEQFNKLAFEKGAELQAKRAQLMLLESSLRGKGEKEATQSPADPFALVSSEATSVAPPLYVRIISQMQRLAPLLEEADNAAHMAAVRLKGAKGKTGAGKVRDELDDADGKAFDLQARMEDLQRRIAIVEAARLGSAKSGALARLPYGQTISKRGKAYSIDNPIGVQSDSPEQRAVGLDQVKALLANPDNGLTADARRVSMDLLAHPGLQNLDWSALTVEIRNRLEGNVSGAAVASDNLIQIAKGSRPSTFAHEAFHLLYELLPAEVKDQLNEFRHEEIMQAMRSFGASMPPDAVGLFRRLLGDGVTSQEYVDMMNQIGAANPDALPLLRDWYKLANPSEYLAGIGGEEFSKQSFYRRNAGLFDRMMERIKSWLRAFMDALGRFFGKRPDIQQIIRDILSGKYKPTPEAGAEAERATSLSIEPPEQSPDSGLSPADLEIEVDRALNESDRTKVFGRTDTILGREHIGPAEREAGSAYAAGVFAKAGLQVDRQENGLWKLTDPDFESEIEGRRLLEVLKEEISTQNEPGRNTGFLGNLLNSVLANMTGDDVGAFSGPLKDELYSIAQGERSHRGILLAALQGFSKTVTYVARHVDVVLKRTYSDAFGGEFVRKVLNRIASEFRDYFTEDEINAALSQKPELAAFVDKAAALNRADEGGRVYRRVQGLLKPKARKKLATLERDARVTEAVRDILQQAKEQGIEPVPSPNKPLPPLQQLIHLVHPNTAAKIEKLIAQSITQGMRNAGIKAALAGAGDEEEREELQGRFAAGEEPTDEQIETGLNLPEYAHWKVIRDTMLGYNPVTIKLVQTLLKSDFRGTRFAPPAASVADTRIDLEKLAKSPENEVKRVLDAYSQNIEASMNLASATPETRQKVRAMVENMVSEQLEAARQRVRGPMFKAPSARTAPLTPEQRIGQLINAGLFGDERLDVPAMVARVAARSAIARLTPKVGELVRRALQTPFYRQGDLSENFARQLVDQLGISPEQAQKAAEVFTQAFAERFNKAKDKAAKIAESSLTPQEQRFTAARKPLWKKIVENANAGNFDSGDVLRQIAQAHGWSYSDAAVARMKELSARLQRLTDLTKAEEASAGTKPEDIAKALKEKEAMTLEARLAIKKEMQTIWARLTKPLGLKHYLANRRNIAAALNEFEVANLLLKIGFPIRLATHITTQLAVHTPTRAIGEALVRFMGDKAAGRETRLWMDLYGSVSDAYKDTLKAVVPALQSARAALMGRAEVRNVDRLMTGMQAMERASLKADELYAKGDYVRATMLKLVSLVRVSLRITQALDNFQGTPAEAQELRAVVITSLRENGRSPAEAEVLADKVLGVANDAMPKAVADARAMWDAQGIERKPAELAEDARNLVKARVYQAIRELGLPVDDFEERIRLLRSTIAWQERTTTGPGGVVASAGKGLTSIFQSIGLPMSFTRFANAFGTGINYSLMFTPFYGLANARLPGAEPSPWFATETDRMQRRAQAMLGSLFGAAIFALFATGALLARLKWPESKEEREALQASGHRLGTIEIPLNDHEFIPISLSVGPFAMLSPYIAAGAAIHDLFVKRQEEQKKLEAEAAKTGLPAGKIRPIDAADVMGVAASAAANVVMGGKTATGLASSVTEQGIGNSKKTAAAYLSPLVPGLPAYQEISRMLGVNLDSKIASIFDFMVPLPSSQARAVNMLGDPVGTPDAVQRVFQVLTAGTYPGVVNADAIKSNAAYAALFNSQFRPPAIDPNKGYAINGEFRPLTDAELARFAVLRGQMTKQAMIEVGPGADAKIAKSAFDQANQAALSQMGIDIAGKVSSSTATGPVLPPTAASRFVAPGSSPMQATAGGRSRGVSGFRGLRGGLRRPTVGARGGIRALKLGSSLRRPKAFSVPRGTARTGSRAGSGGMRSLRPRH